MRHVLCGKCLDDKHKQPGTRLIYPRSDIGEPAEYERVMIGVAKTPQASQRYIAINGVKETLPLDVYNCDSCNADIRPGERTGTWTVWTEETGEPIPWESEYIESAGTNGE